MTVVAIVGSLEEEKALSSCAEQRRKTFGHYWRRPLLLAGGG